MPTQPGPHDGSTRSPSAPPAALRVLLIEDDAADAFLVRELLSEAGAAVELTVATSLAQASAVLHRDAGATDCVLLDLGLPDATGLDGLRHLLSLVAPPAICVLTGYGDEHLGVAAVAEGAQDYLIKGQVDGVLLARSLRYAVERRRAEENVRRLREVELLQQQSARLERGLLPQPLLHTDAVQVHTFYQPGRQAAQLGGDFYDVVQTSPHRVAMMVGDVCGHGVDEAALGVELRVSWRALVLAGVPDDEILPAVEQVLVSERRSLDVFATLAMAMVDLSRREIEVRLAGHPPPLFITKGTAITVPATFGPVLGVFDSARRPATRTLLSAAPWSLLMFTDGLVEGRVDDGEERLGVNGLRALITSHQARDVSSADLPTWLIKHVEAANHGPLVDDVAMLLLCGGSTE